MAAARPALHALPAPCCSQAAPRQAAPCHAHDVPCQSQSPKSQPGVNACAGTTQRQPTKQAKQRTRVNLVQDGHVCLQARQLQDLVPLLLAACREPARNAPWDSSRFRDAESPTQAGTHVAPRLADPRALHNAQGRCWLLRCKASAHMAAFHSDCVHSNFVRNPAAWWWCVVAQPA